MIAHFGAVKAHKMNKTGGHTRAIRASIDRERKHLIKKQLISENVIKCEHVSNVGHHTRDSN